MKFTQKSLNFYCGISINTYEKLADDVVPAGKFFITADTLDRAKARISRVDGKLTRPGPRLPSAVSYDNTACIIQLFI